MTSRLSPAQRREQIVRAARSAIAQRGLAATALRDIAAAAGVSIGTVTYHFASTDEILRAVVIAESERFYGDVITAADAEPDARRALQLIIEPLFGDSADVQAHWRIWADYWAIVARRPEIAGAYAMRIRSWEACCVRIITRGVDDGTFRTVDPDETALKLAAYSDGLGTQLAQDAQGITTEAARNWMFELIDLLLGPRAGHLDDR
ncbi:TetR/AcrR family transcriptional regulator [Microlunatus soli]|uniref:Regulatory protein, tetR family n=1 Tax=Microlunatus soli TaxID=630515 RepID=A0A1H1TZJ7_9ACTN|nr:TetR family transcriptional regulator C-terminal domain-containing protein [Microlunatus soli]SDS65647.1 regulatory protein, tetR family [Microlunatus soli]